MSKGVDGWEGFGRVPVDTGSQAVCSVVTETATVRGPSTSRGRRWEQFGTPYHAALLVPLMQ